MQCPVDGTELLMTQRDGIEIDYCPKCRGVWLDRGELDKIIERSAQQEATYRRQPDMQQPSQPGVDYGKRKPGYDSDDDYDYDDRRPGYDNDPRSNDPRSNDPRYNQQGKRRKGGLLGDLFDIFD